MKDTRTNFMLCWVTRDDHGHDVQSFGAAAKAVDAGNVWTFVIHRLHELWKEANGSKIEIPLLMQL